MRKSIGATILAALLSLSAPAYASDLQKSVAQDYPYLFSLYKHLHTHPELSFKEVETAKRIGDELELAGFEVTR